MMKFTIEATDGQARCGRLQTAHGSFTTPVFMPVGTRAAVKTMSPAQLQQARTPILLCNTYHLAVRPGADLIAKLGGLHRFMGWSGPILTDSGGYQVFSLAALRDITDSGVTFRNHIDGAQIVFTPEKVITIQRQLGSDLVMPLDHCTPWPCEHEQVAQALQRTLLWAQRSQAVPLAEHQTLFGIVQGGTFADLRQQAAEELARMQFAGYAIGGLSVGEPKEAMAAALQACLPYLPFQTPHYLMGVGFVEDILMAVTQGIDMFDCVVATRNARGGGAFTWQGPLQIRNATYREDPRPLEEGCPCYACQTFSRAYLHHLFCKKVEEILGLSMLTLHNLTFFQRFMAAIQTAIRQQRLAQFRDEFLAQYRLPERAAGEPTRRKKAPPHE